MIFRTQFVIYSPEVMTTCVSMCLCAANSHVGLDDFVEMTKKYAQGITSSPVMDAAGGDDDDDDDVDGVVVKSPDELPLHQKVRI